MTYINRRDREWLIAILDPVDDGIDQVTSREAKDILSGCKRAISHLVAGSATPTTSPETVDVPARAGDA